MISRRKVLKILTGLPFGGLMIGALAGMRTDYADGGGIAAGFLKGEKDDSKNVSSYESIGVRPLINARGTVTVVGATRILPEVEQAMSLAVRNYVQLDELMEGVGNRLAELTGAEWGCVTAGASAAITVATAGCVTGGDPDKICQLPDLSGMRDEVIIPSYSRTAYDAAARAVGVKMVEVQDRNELKAALGPRTAMIMVLTGRQSQEGPLSISEMTSLAKPLGVPILADAAAEELVVPNPHLARGADLVAYSGGKALRGPQCAGLLIGRKDLVQAAWINNAPHHGLGRGMKVGREEIMGMLTAVEMWMKRDHEAEQRRWTSWLEQIADRLGGIRGVSTEIRQPRGLSNRYPSLGVEWDTERIQLTGHDVERLLWDGNPRIAVSGMGSFLPFPPNMQPTIRINPSQLEADEVGVIAGRVYAVLSDPPQMTKPAGIPDVDVSGQWDLEMQFVAGMEQQRLVFEQDGNDLIGTHHAGFASRDLAGTLHGHDILLRSSYTEEGVRLNFEFTGTVDGETMEGSVSLGEYGMAGWKAKRRDYQPPGTRR